MYIYVCVYKTYLNYVILFSGPGSTTEPGNAMPREAQDTSRLLNFGNSSFDSVNGAHGRKNSTPLRSKVSSHSGHVHFWKKATKTIRSMRYNRHEDDEACSIAYSMSTELDDNL